jgi:hypothetical protein
LARAREVALIALACGSGGCDVVQGFQHAGDALFPPEKTYLDVPGYRLTAGHYGYVDMVTTSEPFVLARSATAGDETMFIMRYQTPRPCAVANVHHFYMDGGHDTPRTYLAYTDATGSPLRFADVDCKSFDLTLEHAGLPIGFSATGLIVQVGSDLFDVNPEAGTTDLLATNVQGYDAQRRLVRADGRLGVFDADWKLVRWVGDGVVTMTPAFGAVFFQDSTGIQRLTVTDGDAGRSVATLTVAENACDLAILPSLSHLELLAFHAPCGGDQLAVWDAQTRQTAELDLPADPRFLRIQAPLGAGRPNLGKDPYWATYLTDIDAQHGIGTLVVKAPDGASTVIGQQAALERSELRAEDGADDYTGGFALLDTEGATGRLVSFDLAGNTTEIATRVVRQPAENAWTRLVIDVDGTLADLAEIVDGEAVRVARNVPRNRYAYVNRANEGPLAHRMAWFHDVTGDTGTLSLAAPDPAGGPLDDQGREPLYRATPVARGVYAQGHGFMKDLPGFVYFTHWDAASGTGDLEYSNEELGFSAIISEGVADYVQPGAGILYTVPFGEGAGIWLARGK